MYDIKVSIPEKDKFIAAMAKALAFPIARQSCVKGATGCFLAEHGHIVIHFTLDSHVSEFRRVLSWYLPKAEILV
jgi:hypothetical protein